MLSISRAIVLLCSLSSLHLPVAAEPIHARALAIPGPPSDPTAPAVGDGAGHTTRKRPAGATM